MQNQLLKKKEKIFSYSPSKALKTIIDAEDSISLIRSFTEEDLYFLMNEIGVSDFLPVLASASNSQWEYILDVEIWEKDRVSIKSLDIWFANLFESFQERFCNYMLNEKLELAELYFLKTMDIKIRKEDEDPADFRSGGFITFDDTFYIRAKNKKNKSLEILKYLAKYDYQKYQRILFEILAIIPSEIEEENYQKKSVRLSEKGFLPFEEAISIYQIMSYKELDESKKYKAKYDKKIDGYYKKVLSSSLKIIENKNVLNSITTELAFLCNQMAVLSRTKIKRRNDIEKIKEKAMATLKIAIEILAEKKGAFVDANFTATIFKEYPVSSLFRFGYSEILKLKNRANKWLKNSWFKKEKLTLHFLGETKMGFLGGLFLPAPLFFSNSSYKNFSSLKEIKIAEKELSDTILIDEIFSILKPKIRTKIKPKIKKDKFLNYKKLLLTLWAKRELEITSYSIPFEKFKKFFIELFNKNGEIKKEAKKSFLNFIETETKIKTDIFDSFLVREIEEEYKNVSKKDIDKRFVKNFIIH